MCLEVEIRKIHLARKIHSIWWIIQKVCVKHGSWEGRREKKPAVFCEFVFNSCGLVTPLWRQRSGSTLAPITACYLTAPSQWLNQWWVIANGICVIHMKAASHESNSWYQLVSLAPKLHLKLTAASFRGQWFNTKTCPGVFSIISQKLCKACVWITYFVQETVALDISTLSIGVEHTSRIVYQHILCW